LIKLELDHHDMRRFSRCTGLKWMISAMWLSIR